MSNLNNLEIYRELDRSGMYLAIFNFPEQIEKAAVIGAEFVSPKGFADGIEQIVLAGMGGSAIGGNLAESLLRYRLEVPFTICRNYRIPKFVGEKTLFIASSYSGNTEETIAAFRKALEGKAKSVCITTGGEIERIAVENGVPVIKIPPGLQPRAALGFSVVPLMYLLKAVGLAQFENNFFVELAKGLKAYRAQYVKELESSKNPAKQLAEKLYGKIPLIYSGPDLFDAIAMRWKGQFCENAETLAFCNHFSEFNHNELVGFNKIDPVRENLIAIFLRDTDDHPGIAARYPIVAKSLEKSGIEVVNIHSQGDFPLGRVFSLIQLGDFASYYLAILNKVDPSPVAPIEELKQALSQN